MRLNVEYGGLFVLIVVFLWHIELIVGMDTFALAMENMEWRWI